ncbi:hypothetical protein [Niabella beijingensis]|uniref:hypothetical protein n=1 Tax=Niabella beijingensis TaxID=2872700 RepID=UPI001CBB439B|nr:hypothetical protein [Niabella beijingensis]MBZ4188973.1 hypothetical protein [Niabella beijingensis]
MLIEKDAVKKFVQTVKAKFEIDSDTVFCPQGIVDTGDLHFCCGLYDEALFRHDHPMDIYYYKSYDVRTLYETLTLLGKHKIPISEFTHKDHFGKELIDVGGIVQKRHEDQLLRIRNKPRIIGDHNNTNKLKRR